MFRDCNQLRVFVFRLFLNDGSLAKHRQKGPFRPHWSNLPLREALPMAIRLKLRPTFEIAPLMPTLFFKLVYYGGKMQQQNKQSPGMETTSAEQQNTIDRLIALIQNSRSPGLFNSPEELLTERLLAHPVKSPPPQVQLTSQPAMVNPNRLRVAERLLKAYHRAVLDESRSPLKREGEDLWSSLIRKELPELMDAIDWLPPDIRIL